MNLGKVLRPLVKLPANPVACWEWVGCKRAEDGLALKQFNGRSMPARRWLWETLFGPIPRGYVIAQTCGNKSCVNPYHLKRTTISEAIRLGESATLLSSDVHAIRVAHAEHLQKMEGKKRKRINEFADRMAKAYGVSRSSILEAYHGTTWRSQKKHHSAISPSEARG